MTRKSISFIQLSILLLGLSILATVWWFPAVQSAPEASTPELIQAAVDAGTIDPVMGETYLAYALSDPSQLPPAFHSQQPWDGTLALLSLTVDETTAVADLTPARQDIQMALTSGSCGPMSTPLPHVYTTAHFHIEYEQIAGGLTIEDYATTLEATYATLIEAYGWAMPPTDAALNGRYPVRIESLSMGLYGFISDRGEYAGLVTDNPHTPWPEKYAYATCMVLKNDYSGFYSEPLALLQSTVAHEYTHAVQHGYGALRNHDLQADVSFVEGTATLMEDEVFDGANDNYHYLWPEFDSCMGEYAGEPVSSWLAFRGLTERFGTAVSGGSEDIIQQIWEANGQGVSNNLQALADALEGEGVTLSQAYHDYAIAARFTKGCGGGYEAPYCFKEGDGYVSTRGQTTSHGAITAVDETFSGQVQNNFALNWIDLPAEQGYYTVELANMADSGQLHASVVCDTGSSLRVNSVADTVHAADVSTSNIIASDGCEQVVLVVTNQEMTGENPNRCSSHAYEVQITPFVMPENMSEQVFLPVIVR